MTVCVVCRRIKGDAGNVDPDLCSSECRDDWEASVAAGDDYGPSERCGMVNGTNGSGWVFIPPSQAMAARRQTALRLAYATGFVRVSDLRPYFAMSHETLRKDVRALVDQGYLIPKSDRRGRFYVPAGRDGIQDERRAEVLEAVRHG